MLRFDPNNSNDELLQELRKRAAKRGYGSSAVEVTKLLSPQEEWDVIRRFAESISVSNATEQALETIGVKRGRLEALPNDYEPSPEFWEVVNEIIRQVLRRLSESSAKKSHWFENELEEIAIGFAREIYAENPQQAKKEVARKIRDKFLQAFPESGTMKIVKQSTIEKWITPAVPASRKSGGRLKDS